MNLQPSPLRRRRSIGRPSLSALAATGLVVAMVLGAVPSSSARADSGFTSDEVAAEILRIQNKANNTAEAFNEATFQAEALADQLVVAQQQVAAAEADFTTIDAGLTKLAVERYMGGGGSGAGLLFQDPLEPLQAQALTSAAIDAAAVTLDRVETVQTNLDAQRANLEELTRQNSNLTAVLAAQQNDLAEQLEALAALKERLVDAETKRAYEALLAKQRAEQAEADRLAEQKRQSDAAAAAAAAERQNSSQPSDQSVIVITDSNATPPPQSQSDDSSTADAPQAPDPGSSPASPAEAPAAAQDESDNDSAPIAPPDPPAFVRDFACPVNGPTAFGDTWGAARSGGRRHEGVDLISPRGVPLVAVVSGSVHFKTTSLGGNSVWLTSTNGDRYFYAHLDRWEGSSRPVSIGETIGYVGATGNANGTNHLHFEFHPGGGAAVNPYPLVRRNC